MTATLGTLVVHRRLLALGAALAAAFVLFVAFSQPAAAYGGPHGNYDASTDKCAACHRVHQAKSNGKLLKEPNQFLLCISCHNGTGSVLDVVDGVRIDMLPGARAGIVNLTGSPAYGAYSTISANAVATRSGVASFPDDMVAHATDVVGRSNNADYSVWITPAAQPVGTSAATYTVYVKRNTAGAAIALTAGADAARDETGAGKANPFTVGALGAASLDPAVGSVASTTFTVSKNTASAGDVLQHGLTASDGTYSANLSTLSWVDNSYTPNLLGGGFEYINGNRVTSRHDADPAWGRNQPWGFAGSSVTSLATYANGTVSPAVGQSSQRDSSKALGGGLQCVLCHNPHGTPNYRLLKEVVNGITVDVQAFDNSSAYTSVAANFVTDETGKDYINEHYGSKNAGSGTANSSGGFANFCGGCHTAYPSDGAGLGLTGTSGGSNPSETHYRHRTEMGWFVWADPRGSTFTRSNPEALGYTTKGSTGITKLPLANTPHSDATPNTTNTVGAGGPAAYVVTCVTCHRAHGTDASVKATGIAGQFSPLGAPSPAQGDDAGTVVSNTAESATTSGAVGFVIAGTDTVTFTYSGTSFTTAALTAATADTTTLASVASDLQTKLRAAAGDNAITVLATGQLGTNNDVLLINAPRPLSITSSTSAGLGTALSGKTNDNYSGLDAAFGAPTFRSAGITDQSTLLRLPERGVCETCHQWSGKGDGTVG